jgi:hypothetical protein
MLLVYVSSVSIVFRRMFQVFHLDIFISISICCITCMFRVFHLDVAKVDLDIAYIVMAIHTCFKCIFQVFHRFLVICCICCKYFS